ncbi:hypothetical protein GII36_04645 [Candidatus Mycosynbacter amalyticus]|uniref:Uncharacterized protein n=1 Tax=Candidatus Mycosynbacter amalyticus TaxID=2665156 RepID=A0A857MKJ2_9BACT|nr:hypothetical protein [Candidatus Mycosynbacter amalyticus]QHN43114.1 hypothetical protein GII36_04645 [Candidatus Mycosynbacter amalyticus]
MQLVYGEGTAQATSAYDSALLTVDKLEIQTYGTSVSSCARKDISQSYDEYILNSSKWESGIDSSMTASFSNALDHGQIGVSQFVYGSSGVTEYSVIIYWTEDFSLQLDWRDAYNVFAVSSTSSTMHFAQIYYDASCNDKLMFYTTSYNSGVNVSNGVTVSYSAPSSGMAIGQYAFDGEANYPVGYAGEVVSTIQAPPVEAVYSGTVDCGGEEPVLMSIYQPGNNGAATLSAQSLGRANWVYSLRDASYTVTVDCGGGKIAGVFSAVRPEDGTDWVCDIYGTEPYYCVLS